MRMTCKMTSPIWNSHSNVSYTEKNDVSWDVTPVDIVRRAVSEECFVSIVRVKRISELGTTLAVTSNWNTLRRDTNYTERISELGTALAVTSNWNTLRRETNYMERISELRTTLAITSNWNKLRRDTNYMERISELGTTLATTNNWRTLRRSTGSYC
jgi:hypothetical protein